MASKKKLTFGDRAKKIMKKYDLRPDDNASKEALNRELGVLKEEQEAYKQKMAQDAFATLDSLGYGAQQGGPGMMGDQMPQQQFAYGGNMKQYAGGGPFETQDQERAFQDWMNRDGDVTGGYGWGKKSQAAYDQYGEMYNDSLNPTAVEVKNPYDAYQDYQNQNPQAQQQPAPADTGGLTLAEQKQAEAMFNPSGPQQSYEGEEFNPWIAGAQGLGDAIGLAYSLKQPEHVDLGEVSASRTDTTAAENEVDKQMASARLAQTAMQRGNPGAARTNAIIGNTMLGDKGARAKAGIIANAENDYTLRKDQADAQNLALDNQANEMNIQARDRRMQNIVAHTQGLGDTVAGAHGDNQRTNQQNDIIRMMETGNYRYITDENGQTQIVPIT